MSLPSWICRVSIPVLATLLLTGVVDAVVGRLGAPTSVVVAMAKDGGGDGGSGGGGGERGERGDGHESGGKGRGRSGERGSDDRDRRGKDDQRQRGKDDGDRRSLERYVERLQKRNEVAWTRRDGERVSVRYSDGWTETVAGGRYRLTDGRNRLVAERAARDSDRRRLSAAERGGW